MAGTRPLLITVSKDIKAEIKASLILILVQTLTFVYQKSLCLFRLHIFLTIQDAGIQEYPLSNHTAL